jgi:FdhD protein
MDEQDKQPEVVKYVEANRISTGDTTERPDDENVCVILEVPVTIDVEGIETYTVLCSPIDIQAMAIGFLFTEGVIDGMDDIKTIRPCDDDPDTIRVRLTKQVPKIADPDRNLLIVSSCGACGSENLRQRIESLPSVNQTLSFEARKLRLVHDSLRHQQRLFKLSGGTHAAAVFDETGNLISFAEDTGRHNALDKAIGKCLQEATPTTGNGVALTSRLSLEMVSKCARAGIELISAVSAPTSMAIDVARQCNITLCAFVRETRATVFTHPERIIGIDD